MVINGTDAEKQPLIVDNLTVKWCKKYKYLGCMFTADGRASSAVAADAAARMCQALKFTSFIEKNNDAPFYIKKKVFDACVMSSLLYGCETWLSADLRPIKRLYNMCIKTLLGVRHTTSNDLCLIELGLPELQATVYERQKTFFKTMSTARENMIDDPLQFALRLCLGTRTLTSRYVQGLLSCNTNKKEESLAQMKQKITTNTQNSSRFEWFKTVNQPLSVNKLYTEKVSNINELHRVAWTRLRLSAHTLAIEQGRWNRRGRGRLRKSGCVPAVQCRTRSTSSRTAPPHSTSEGRTASLHWNTSRD